MRKVRLTCIGISRQSCGDARYQHLHMSDERVKYLWSTNAQTRSSLVSFQLCEGRNILGKTEISEQPRISVAVGKEIRGAIGVPDRYISHAFDFPR